MGVLNVQRCKCTLPIELWQINQEISDNIKKTLEHNASRRRNSLILLIVFLFSVIIYCIFYNNYKEPFETIITDFVSDNTGFYAMFFKILNHYMHCKANSKNFEIDSTGWIFKVNEGWTDYFKNTELTYDTNNDKEMVTRTDLPSLQDFTIKEYQKTLPELYIYNQKTKDEIKRRKDKINMFSNYDAIFIRRGDKLAKESKYVETSDYVDLLLKKNPNCKNIFLQTDDYNCYLDLIKYINDNNLDINTRTLCDKDSVGAIMHNYRKDELSEAVNQNQENKEYLSKIIDKLKTTKAV